MKRIIFIDLIRTFAILSMVQGHLISGVLAEKFTQSGSALYSYWNFNRGLTAPVFFFVSGCIFTYLLFKKNENSFLENPRVKKGIKRALVLIGTGYLLQFNMDIIWALPNINIMDFTHMFLSHVLHCIGFGLLAIIGAYFLHKKMKMPYPLLSVIAALGIFLITPTVNSINWLEIFPLPVATYFNKDYNSIFPLFPWVGFVFWGSALGWVIHKRPGFVDSYFFPLILVILGIILKLSRTDLLELAYEYTGWENFKEIFMYDYTFYHLPHVLIVFGIFALIPMIFRKIPKGMLEIGQNTLLVYVLHVLLLYGCTFYSGLVPAFKHSLDPIQSILMALISEILLIVLVLKRQFFIDLYFKYKPIFLNKLARIKTK